MWYDNGNIHRMCRFLSDMSTSVHVRQIALAGATNCIN